VKKFSLRLSSFSKYLDAPRTALLFSDSVRHAPRTEAVLLCASYVQSEKAKKNQVSAKHFLGIRHVFDLMPGVRIKKRNNSSTFKI
jgi:hypothetical protein